MPNEDAMLALALVGGGLAYLWAAPRFNLPGADFIRNLNGGGVGAVRGIRRAGPYDTVTQPYHYALPQPSIQPRLWESGRLNALAPGYTRERGGTVRFLGNTGGEEYVSPTYDGDELVSSGVPVGSSFRNVAGGRHSVSIYDDWGPTQTPGRKLTDEEADAGLPLVF
jgi:hypothetical protein